MKLRKKVSLAVVALLAAGSLASCSAGGNDSQGPIEEFPEKWDEQITIDVFDGLANYMGVQEGWFGKLVEDKFNMKLNIIAPNVAGGGDTLYNTRVSAGGPIRDHATYSAGRKTSVSAVATARPPMMA